MVDSGEGVVGVGEGGGDEDKGTGESLDNEGDLEPEEVAGDLDTGREREFDVGRSIGGFSSTGEGGVSGD